MKIVKFQNRLSKKFESSNLFIFYRIDFFFLVIDVARNNDSNDVFFVVFRRKKLLEIKNSRDQ